MHAALLLVLSLTFSCAIGADRLLFVQIVWRHGDRAPTDTYPSDVHKESEWHFGWGELTELGMKQQYALGRVIRKRYITDKYKLLSLQYNPKEVYIRSSDVNRTLVSALSNLAAMYPFGVPGSDYPRTKNNSWPVAWTPIPVHTVDFDTDHVLNVFASCPRAAQLDTAIHKSKRYMQIYEENKEFLDFLSNKTQMKVTLENIFFVNDARLIEEKYNLSQPDWFSEEISEKVRNLSKIEIEFKYGISRPYVPELIKLRGGSLLKAIIANMKMKVDCENKGDADECRWYNPLKYYAFSAHDTTVAALLATFGDEEKVIEGGLPEYTASVAVELWQKDGVGYAVKLLFHEAFHHNYRPITKLTKGCPKDSDFCPLKQFEKRSKKFIPDDITNECRPKRQFNSFRIKALKGL